ncbi:MAG: SMP-30/gluconolactonase/LRE family protein, partial [Streptosporangiaceae bacterium]
EIVVDVTGGFGESPSWSEAEQALLWVAAPGLVHRFHPGTGRNDTFTLPAHGLAIVPAASGAYLVVQARSVWTLDPATGNSAPFAEVAGMPDGTRLNDAKTDPAGNLWFGSVEERAVQEILSRAAAGEPASSDTKPVRQGAGSLYRMDRDGVIDAILGDVGISNGLGWSPDLTTMYFIDTAAGLVDQLDFDAEAGRAGGRRDYVSVASGDGLPDGMAVDADGGTWVALFGGGCLRRYDPAGVLTDQVEFPVRQVTSCCFGGADLADLYVTTAGIDGGLHGGSLFRLRPPVGGLPTWPFGA